MKKITILTAIAAIGLATSSAAFANHTPLSTPWYMGVGINYSANMTDQTGNSSSTNSSELDSKGAGGNIFVGYRANRYFGTEAGFSYLGNDTYQEHNQSFGQFDTNLTNQWNLHWVGNAYLPISSRLEPYAFGGVGYLHGKIDTEGNADVEDYAGLGLLYGAGVQFNFNQLGIRASYTQQRPSSSINQSAEISVPKDYISLDVLYHFEG